MEQGEAEQSTIFEALVWAGAGLTIVGLVGLIWCILRVNSARRSKLSDDEMRDAVRRVLPWNLGALAVSALGLMLVVVGVFLA